jgi:hypothetical protein
VLALEPTWADKVTAIATAVSAVALLGAVSAGIFAGQQVREARRGRHAQTALEFLRRWDEDALVESRRLVAGFRSTQQLADGFRGYIERNDREAYVLYRELDFFEQLAALERLGAVDFELINMLLGPRLVERWEMWRPSIAMLWSQNPYPLFEQLAAKVRQAVGASGASGSSAAGTAASAGASGTAGSGGASGTAASAPSAPPASAASPDAPTSPDSRDSGDSPDSPASPV